MLTPAVTNGLTGNPVKPTTIGITATLEDVVTSGVELGRDQGRGLRRTGGRLHHPADGQPQRHRAVEALDRRRSDHLDGRHAARVDRRLRHEHRPAGLRRGHGRRGQPGNGANVPLLLDKAKPTIGATFSAVQSGANNQSLALSVSPVVDPTPLASGLSRTEYYLGTTDPGLGAGIVMAVSGGGVATATVNLNTTALASGGPVTVNVRSRDVAGNWSTTRTLTTRLAAPGDPLRPASRPADPAFNRPPHLLPADSTSSHPGPIAGPEPAGHGGRNRHAVRHAEHADQPGRGQPLLRQVPDAGRTAVSPAAAPPSPTGSPSTPSVPRMAPMPTESRSSTDARSSTAVTRFQVGFATGSSRCHADHDVERLDHGAPRQRRTTSRWTSTGQRRGTTRSSWSPSSGPRRSPSTGTGTPRRSPSPGLGSASSSASRELPALCSSTRTRPHGHPTK